VFQSWRRGAPRCPPPLERNIMKNFAAGSVLVPKGRT
jgi:hypothetical protein